MTDNGKKPDNAVQVPLAEWVREVAKEAARTVIQEHLQSCPGRKAADRVGKLERNYAFLVGAILGSGLLGGFTAAMLMKLGG